MDTLEKTLANEVKSQATLEEAKASYDKWLDSLTDEELQELALEDEADRMINEQKSFPVDD